MLHASQLTFQHRSIGRRGDAKGTAAAHVHYITRPTACTHFEAENMPIVRRDAMAYFDRLAEQPAERVNARICDKLIMAPPNDLAAFERHEVVRSFMRKLGHGRIAWCAAFHDAGKDHHNPHVHVVFRDRDIETNRRVIGTTTSLQYLRQARLRGWTVPFATSEHLRLLWREHLAQFCAPRAAVAMPGAGATSPPLPSTSDIR